MSKADLSGQTFGGLKVLSEHPDPYRSPTTGKATRRWVCLCLVCGKETVTLHNSLTRNPPPKSCGCLPAAHAPRQKTVKVCPVCGKEFFAPPTGNTTCSRDCFRALRGELSKTGHKWSLDRKQALRERPDVQERAAALQPKATAAALAIPEGQRGSQHRACKEWILIDPSGNYHHVVGLLPLARENYQLFEPYSTNVDASACRISKGFIAIASYSRGVRSRKGKPVTTYKGWRLAEEPRQPKKPKED